MTKTTESMDTNEVIRMIREGDKAGIINYLRNGGDPNARNNLGWTVLHLACVEDQAEIAEILLDGGSMVNCCTVEMSTPLHEASARGNKKAVEVLVSKGAYINAQDKQGNTALHEASKGLYTPVVKFLLSKNADKDRMNKRDQTFIDTVGQQLLAVVESGDIDVLLDWLDWGLSPDTVGNLNWSLLHHASARGQINIASILLERDANVNCVDSNKSSPLHAASFHGHWRIAELLIGKGALINTQDQMGNTPLLSAIVGGHPDIINLLLDSGCDTELMNNEGQVFTHLVNEFLVDAVVKNQNEHVVSLLKGRANPDTKDNSGNPVLCCASFKGNQVMVDALLAAGANPNLCSEDNLKSPLHYVSSLGHFFALKSLLDKGASVHLRDIKNATPLHEAARHGGDDVITVLIARGSPLDAQDVDGNTALHIAARWGNALVVDILIEKGAEEKIRNKAGLSYSDLGLMYAVRSEDVNAVVSGLAWGGNPDVRDHRGWTLLHHAVYKGAKEVTRALLECGAVAEVAGKHGRTPLMLAAYRDDAEIARALLDAGASPSSLDLSGNTALHWAADQGSLAVIELLLSFDADKSIVNGEGLTFSNKLLKHLFLAVRHNDGPKVDILLRVGADPSAVLKGTEVSPKEEAIRRKSYVVLKKIIAHLPKKPLAKLYSEEAKAVEDVWKLFEEDGYLDEPMNAEDNNSDEEAHWKMKNANFVLSAKEIFQNEDNDLWDYWEEKPKVVSAKEYFKEPPWWETNSSSSDGISSDEERESVPTFDEMKKNWGNVVSAKEYFKEEECWWRDAVEDLDSTKPKVISASEFFKDESPWWCQDSNELREEESPEKDNEVTQAKDLFKEEPWWEENDSDGDDDVSESSSNSDDKSEENSQYEDLESFTEEWETCNDTSDTSTMYSACDGEKVLAKDFFAEKAWWHCDDEYDRFSDHTNDVNDVNILNKSCNEDSDVSEMTETIEDCISTENDLLSSRRQTLCSTDSDASNDALLDNNDDFGFDSSSDALKNVDFSENSCQKEDEESFRKFTLKRYQPDEEALNIKKDDKIDIKGPSNKVVVNLSLNKDLKLPSDDQSEGIYMNDNCKKSGTFEHDLERWKTHSNINQFQGSEGDSEHISDINQDVCNKLQKNFHSSYEEDKIGDSNLTHSSTTDKSVQNVPMKFKSADFHSTNKQITNSKRCSDEKLVTLKNPPVINKMDSCLARLDASLAWLDAAMGSNVSNSNECPENIGKISALNNNKQTKDNLLRCFYTENNMKSNFLSNQLSNQVCPSGLNMSSGNNYIVDRLPQNKFGKKHPILKTSLSEDILDSEISPSSNDTLFQKRNSFPDIQIHNSSYVACDQISSIPNNDLHNSSNQNMNCPDNPGSVMECNKGLVGNDLGPEVKVKDVLHTLSDMKDLKSSIENLIMKTEKLENPTNYDQLQGQNCIHPCHKNTEKLSSNSNEEQCGEPFDKYGKYSGVADKVSFTRPNLPKYNYENIYQKKNSSNTPKLPILQSSMVNNFETVPAVNHDHSNKYGNQLSYLSGNEDLYTQRNTSQMDRHLEEQIRQTTNELEGPRCGAKNIDIGVQCKMVDYYNET